MRVIVTGGRNYLAGTKVFNVLDELKPNVIIQGGAPGADSLAKAWADDRGVLVITYHYFNKAGRGGGPARNRFMCRDAQADLVVAFPGGRGTESCVREAVERGIEVLRVT